MRRCVHRDRTSFCAKNPSVRDDARPCGSRSSDGGGAMRVVWSRARSGEHRVPSGGPNFFTLAEVVSSVFAVKRRHCVPSLTYRSGRRNTHRCFRQKPRDRSDPRRDRDLAWGCYRLLMSDGAHCHSPAVAATRAEELRAVHFPRFARAWNTLAGQPEARRSRAHAESPAQILKRPENPILGTSAAPFSDRKAVNVAHGDRRPTHTGHAMALRLREHERRLHRHVEIQPASHTHFGDAAHNGDARLIVHMYRPRRRSPMADAVRSETLAGNYWRRCSCRSRRT